MGGNSKEIERKNKEKFFENFKAPIKEKNKCEKINEYDEVFREVEEKIEEIFGFLDSQLLTT